MTFTGYIFRNTLLSEDAVTKYPRKDAGSYAADAKGYGYGTSGVFGYDSPVGDARLNGMHLLNTGSSQLRLDLPNARYNILAALGNTTGASTSGILIYDGAVADGNIIVDTISSGATSIPSGSVLDATGVVRIFSDWAANQGALTLPAPITQGFVTVIRSAANAGHLRYLAFEPIGDPLADVFSDTDDTGFLSAGLTGSLTAGDATIRGVSNTRNGLYAGMYVEGPGIPAGRTIKRFDATTLVSGGSQYSVNDTVTDTAGNKFLVSHVDANGSIIAGETVTPMGTVVQKGFQVSSIASTTNAQTNHASATRATNPVTASPGTGAVFNVVVPNTQMTLNDGTGVVAGTGVKLKIGKVRPKLYDKMPANYPVMPIRVPIGSAANLTVVGANGLTSPYLKVGTFKGLPYLLYTGTVFSGTASTYSFSVVQTDASGVFPGSPHATPFTMDVVYAPGKPTDGSQDAMLTTPCWLERERRYNLYKAFTWPEYKGQSIGTTVQARSLQQVADKLRDLSAISVPGNWYCIELVDDGTSDWGSNGGNSNTTNFLGAIGSENFNGGCIIRNAAGSAPLIKGKLTLRNQRGVQIDRLTWYYAKVPAAQNNGAQIDPMLTIAYTAGAPLTMVNIMNNKFGRYHDPATDPANVLNDIFGGAKTKTDPSVSPFTRGFLFTGLSDQIRFIGNDFFGGFNGIITCGGCRFFESGWNRFRLCTDDRHNMSNVDPIGNNLSASPYIGASATDFSNYIWLHDNTDYRHYDGGTLKAPYDDAGNLYSPHGDLCQTNFCMNGVSVYKLFEENVITNSVENAGTDAFYPASSRLFCDRQFNIHSSVVDDMYDIFIGNKSACTSPRGFDLYNGESWAEFNSLMPAIESPPSTSANIIASVPVIETKQTTSTRGCSRSYRNISTGMNAGPTTSLYSVEDVVVRYDDSSILGTGAANDPSLYFAGPFVADPKDAGRGLSKVRSKFASACSNLDGAMDHRKKLWANAKPLTVAGARQMKVRIFPGESDTIQNGATAVALSGLLQAVTDRNPLKSGAGTVQIRWNRNAGNAGPVDGVDVTLSVS